MSSDSASASAGDEEWKAKVRAENAELEGQAGGEPAPQAGPAPEQKVDARSIPAASFPALVEMFATQAMVALGVITHPVSGKSEPQLPLATHFIDLLSILETKTAGNLTSDEASHLGGTLHFLRMGFVEVSKKPAKTE